MKTHPTSSHWFLLMFAHGPTLLLREAGEVLISAVRADVSAVGTIHVDSQMLRIKKLC